MLSVVLDTNVIHSALRSRKGASAVLFALFTEGRFETNMSTALAFEYESVLKRDPEIIGMTSDQVSDLVGFICANSRQFMVPSAKPIVVDPGDQFLVNLALECRCDYLVTHNMRHLIPLRGEGIKVVTPSAFLAIIRSSL